MRIWQVRKVFYEGWLVFGIDLCYTTTMESTLLFKVQDISESVRDWVEEYAEKRDGIEADDLNGYCAIASAELFKQLKQAGINAELHMAADEEGNAHVFVVVDDFVVDVTATQFKEFRDVPVLIKHHRELQEHWYYRTTDTYTDHRKLRKAQISQGWPRSQIAVAR